MFLILRSKGLLFIYIYEMQILNSTDSSCGSCEIVFDSSDFSFPAGGANRTDKKTDMSQFHTTY